MLQKVKAVLGPLMFQSLLLGAGLKLFCNQTGNTQFCKITQASPFLGWQKISFISSGKLSFLSPYLPLPHLARSLYIPPATPPAANLLRTPRNRRQLTITHLPYEGRDEKKL